MTEVALSDPAAGGLSIAQAERAVIASILLDERVLVFAIDELRGEDFHDVRLGAIFEGIWRMKTAHEPVDVITVGARLADWDVRGISPADLHMWVSEVPAASSVGWYAQLVREAAVRRAIREEGVRLAQISQATEGSSGELVALAVERLKALQLSRVPEQIRAQRLEDVLMGPDDYEWVVEGLLERGDRLLLTGQEGGGKSTLMRQIAVLASAGLDPFWQTPIRPVKVLVVDAENSEKQWRREVRRMVYVAEQRGSRDPARELELSCVRRLDLTADRDLGLVHKLVDEAKPDVLVIGPLYRLVPRAINSDDDAAPLLAALDTIRDRGVALLIEAHAGHAVGSGGERDMRPRGSAALLGWPEFGLGLRKAKQGHAGEFELVRWRGDRDASRKWPRVLVRGASSEWPWSVGS